MNQKQSKTIGNLENRVTELQTELKSWETRAGCWINLHVRDEFESKIEHLKKEVKFLTLKNEKLKDVYKESVAENK